MAYAKYVEVEAMGKINTEEELLRDLKCSDLCFIKDKIKNNDLAEDIINEKNCPC